MRWQGQYLRCRIRSSNHGKFLIHSGPSTCVVGIAQGWASVWMRLHHLLQRYTAGQNNMKLCIRARPHRAEPPTRCHTWFSGLEQWSLSPSWMKAPASVPNSTWAQTRPWISMSASLSHCSSSSTSTHPADPHKQPRRLESVGRIPLISWKALERGKIRQEGNSGARISAHPFWPWNQCFCGREFNRHDQT